MVYNTKSRETLNAKINKIKIIKKESVIAIRIRASCWWVTKLSEIYIENY
jgi:hypothetical protein